MAGAGFDGDLTSDWGEGLSRRAIAHVRLGIENFKDARQRALRFFDLGEQPRKASEGPDEQTGVQDKGNQIARAHRAADDLGTAIPQDSRRGGKCDEGDGRDEHSQDCGPLQCDVERPPDLGGEARLFVSFLHE